MDRFLPGVGEFNRGVGKLNLSLGIFQLEVGRGSVKLIQGVKIAHSFLQPVSNLFHSIILSLPLQFCLWLSKNFRNSPLKMEKKAVLIGRVVLADLEISLIHSI